MSKRFQSFPGMEDILPGEIEKWQWLEERTRIFFEAGGFQEIRTPVLEPTELFARTIGETSDIVHKEMYTLEDRGGRSMTLRPEMTASVARAVIQAGLLRSGKPLSLYYLGPMFRAERPQAGRKRQFHQIGAEIVNESGVAADLKIILALYYFLQYAGLSRLRLRVNDLSRISGVDAEKVRRSLRDYFESHKSALDPDSLYRLDRNVLRIFDSKIPETRAIVEKTPWDDIAPLSGEFQELTGYLDRQGIGFEVDRCLVRGLDYYTGTVFEVASESLGAQDAVAGGGRYDGLYAELGGAATACTGFSIGMERLLTVLDKEEMPLDARLGRERIYLAPLPGEDDAQSRQIQDESVAAAARLRSFGFRVFVGAAGAKPGDHFSRANKMKAGFVLLKGPEEIKKKEWAVKDMNEKTQENVPQGGLLQFLIERLRKEEIV